MWAFQRKTNTAAIAKPAGQELSCSAGFWLSFSPAYGFPEKRGQIGRDALRGIDRRHHQHIHIAFCKVDPITAAADQQRKKEPFCPSVSLPKRVEHIQLMIEIGCLNSQFFFRCVPKFDSLPPSIGIWPHRIEGVQRQDRTSSPFFERSIVLSSPAQG